MGAISKRKFGVKKINMMMEQGNLLCIDCGHRAGLHYGDTWDCPKVDIKTGKELPKNEKIIQWLKEERQGE